MTLQNSNLLPHIRVCGERLCPNKICSTRNQWKPNVSNGFNVTYV